MRFLIVMLPLVLILTACASGGPPPVPMPPRLPPPHLVALSEFPPTLPEPETAQGPDLLSSYTAAAKLYHTLRARFQSLGEWAMNPAMNPAKNPNKTKEPIDGEEI